MPNLMGENVLVTGASGFTGAWLAKHLIESGANVTTVLAHLDTDSYYIRSQLFHKINNVVGNLTDFDFINKVIQDYKISTVFHLAALSIEKLAFINPHAAFEANVRCTYNLLEACRKNSALIKKIIIASSDKAYGNLTTLPYTEDMPVQGLHPYDCSKSCQDLISQSFAYSYNMPIIIGRFGNIFGGGDLNWSRLIPGTIRRLYHNEPPVIHLPPTGEYRRDFLFIKDNVNAYMHMHNALNDPAMHGQSFNFALGSSWLVQEIVDKICAIIRTDIKPIYIESDHEEILHQHVSTEKAATVLNWKPQYSLDKGLIETVDWYLSLLKMQQPANMTVFNLN